MLSKKYYIAIATILRENKASVEIVYALSCYFAEDNPNFDRLRFIGACAW